MIQLPHSEHSPKAANDATTPVDPIAIFLQGYSDLYNTEKPVY